MKCAILSDKTYQITANLRMSFKCFSVGAKNKVISFRRVFRCTHKFYDGIEILTLFFLNIRIRINFLLNLINNIYLVIHILCYIHHFERTSVVMIVIIIIIDISAHLEGF